MLHRKYIDFFNCIDIQLSAIYSYRTWNMVYQHLHIAYIVSNIDSLSVEHTMYIVHGARRDRKLCAEFTQSHNHNFIWLTKLVHVGNVVTVGMISVCILSHVLWNHYLLLSCLSFFLYFYEFDNNAVALRIDVLLFINKYAH